MPAFREATGVEVEIVGFGEMRDQAGVAGPAGEFFEVALTAFSFEGNLYAVPYATEAIAVCYNTDMAAEAPATFEEIGAIYAALEGIEICLGIPGGDGSPAARSRVDRAAPVS